MNLVHVTRILIAYRPELVDAAVVGQGVLWRGAIGELRVEVWHLGAALWSTGATSL